MERREVLWVVDGVDGCACVPGEGVDHALVAAKGGGVQRGAAVAGGGGGIGAELEQLINDGSVAVLGGNVQGSASKLCAGHGWAIEGPVVPHPLLGGP